MSDKPVYVTQPYLPPLEEFVPYLEKIWDSKTLTNGGPMHQQLEKELCEYLGVEHIALFNNGTIALLTALQALRVTGEVITTPYSFVATAHSLLWNGLQPVFVDIDPVTFNLDPKKVEAAITSKTTAIMPVHCYGYSCDTDAIQNIADNYNLKIIYDAAHAFGVNDAGGSILRHGDLSILSFHATKVFNTFEGGAIVCPDAKTKKRIEQLKNFGFVDEVTVVAPGINGKLSEINAAFGLLQLKHIDSAMSLRKEIGQRYSSGLKSVEGISLSHISAGLESNYSYYPILVEDDYPLSRDELYEVLKEQNVFGRRYFFPLISEFSMYRSMPSADSRNLPVAHDISSKVLCLPIYPALEMSAVDKVVEIIHNVRKAS
ncbi:DegT/DnrJ/EryC1/StrS family aminotransferase [Pseudomonas sp. Bout1]|uniref:DegT/DnrJ/EryC1/StrS family aminotransferase n=1 Tax=Pseudomonas sp. Bout1 TaxID=3048600 RepID=UPI002AB39A94|nr:DegT/DnrJ/EryC1/StrS family aminotransferase [Pseudomonas sp. Bout1]MDY7531905.1 DegT/DnrJ/EryC1/StrS family aminotransferase [Pseudomonas sp. Bout1]MEB0185046.1 DegT/DnrJ/EryC1/StrS family aminotransferase [Pseudomonas sp. Bout1]